MSTHSQTTTGFLGAWEQLVGPRGVPMLPPRRGRKPRVPLTRLRPALTWHVMQDTGTVAEHLFQLFREPLADSSWSDRRLRLPCRIRLRGCTLLDGPDTDRGAGTAEEPIAADVLRVPAAPARSVSVWARSGTLNAAASSPVASIDMQRV